MAYNNYITRKGLDKIISQRDLLVSKRQNAVDNLRTAREMGDLSENAAYHVAKQALSSLDRRIRYLNRLIRFSIIAEPVNTGTVGIGSKVKIFDGKKYYDFEIVSSFEAMPENGKISYLSPLGKILMGKSVNARMELETKNGKISYLLVNIQNIPSA